MFVIHSDVQCPVTPYSRLPDSGLYWSFRTSGHTSTGHSLSLISSIK